MFLWRSFKSKNGLGREIYIIRAAIYLLPTAIRVGQCWQIEGRGQSIPSTRNGYSILEHRVKADRLALILPHEGKKFIHFLAATDDFKGIGEVTARQLWQRFGENIYKLLDTADKERLTSCLSISKVDSLLEGWKKYQSLSLLPWFEKHDIPIHLAEKLIKQHSKQAIQRIQDNPYCLISFGGKFPTVDRLAQERLGVTADDPRRLAAAVEDALYNYSKYGHTAAEYTDLHLLITRQLGSSALAEQAMTQEYQALGYVVTKEGLYQSTGHYVMEQVVARRMLSLCTRVETFQSHHETVLQDVLSDLSFSLNQQQQSAVQQALISNVSIITGGAGTGKTTLLKAIMDALTLLGHCVHGISLAGRAVMRLQELTGYPCRTIAGFVLSPNLSTDMTNIVVIDESSMLDLPTMYRIVTAVPDTTRLILVGDADQLMPIGVGRILKDLIDADVLPVTRLEIVNRHNTNSGIEQYSHAIREGRVPEQLSQGSVNFYVVPDEGVNDTAFRLFSRTPEQTQIIAATYKPEQGGIHALNLYIQSALNPDGIPLSGTKIKQGDPIIFTKNNWDKNVQNGMLGRLISVECNEEGIGAVMTDAGDIIHISKDQLEIMELAYVISLHKAQGSQFKRVIIILSSTFMIDRSWLYTAVTRAEMKVDIIGTARQLENAVRSYHLGRRKTALQSCMEKASVKNSS